MRYWLLVFGMVVSLCACTKEAPAPVAEVPAGGKVAQVTQKASKKESAPKSPKNPKNTVQTVPMIEKYVQGQHYVPLTSPVPTIVQKDKVEITEVFRFGCPACFHFEAAVAEWMPIAPKAAEFVKNPVVSDPATMTRAQIYFAGKQLGLEEETTMAVFKGIHEAESHRVGHKSLLKEKDIIAMFVTLGIDAEKAKKMYNSFAVKSSVKQADSRARRFQITGTPELFVDGRYRIINESVKSFDEMLQVASFLVNKVAIERGIKK